MLIWKCGQFRTIGHDSLTLPLDPTCSEERLVVNDLSGQVEGY
jgi:hypothetical protein